MVEFYNEPIEEETEENVTNSLGVTDTYDTPKSSSGVSFYEDDESKEESYEYLEIPEKSDAKNTFDDLQNNIGQITEGSTEETFEDLEIEESGRSFLGDVGGFFSRGEFITAPIEGLFKGVGEATKTVQSMGRKIEDTLNVGKLVWSDGIVPEYWSRKEVRDANLSDSLISSTLNITKGVADFIPDAETVTGSLVQGISQYATGMIITKRLTGVGGVKGTFLNSAITDAAFFDPYEGNLANFAKGQGGILNNTITRSLAIEETDGEFKARLKMASEGLIFGGVLEGFAKVFRSAKAIDKGKKEFAITGEVSDKTRIEMDDAVDDLQNLDFKETVPKNKIEEAVKKRNKKYDPEMIKENTLEVAQDKRVLAKKVVADNKDIEKDFIETFEEKLGESISTKDADGNITGLDFEKARNVKKIKAYEKIYLKKGTLLDNISGFHEVGLIDLARGADKVFTTILKPESLDAIVAVASDFRKSFPKAFDKNKKHTSGSPYRVIDHLFELSVDVDPKTGKRLLETEELLDTLGKYGLSYEEYITSVIGSASDAGKVLQKFSEIGRSVSKTEKQQIDHARILASQGSIRNWIMRIENVRRGLMVSQLATAARNVSSVVIRMPFESIANVMDTALVHAGDGNWGKASRSLLEKENWIGSWRGAAQMMNPVMWSRAKDITNVLLQQPQLVNKFDEMFNQVNEIRKHTGAGKGGTLDRIAGGIEQGVDGLNIFNRSQEYMVRRISFLSEMERLIKREWDVDLIEELTKGNVRDLLGDVSRLKPKGARSFIDITDSSVKKALDITYAKQPDLQIFRDLTSIITRNGLTAIIPFPRFMFNSIELMSQYAAGASIPLTRKLMNMTKKAMGNPLYKDTKVLDDEFSRKLIARNVVGLTMATAAYMYRSGETDNDYKLLKWGDKVIDVTAQFPLRQYMWLGEAIKRFNDDTFGDWYDHKEATQTFLGTNLRTGTGNVLVEEIAELVGGDDDTTKEAMGLTLAKLLGNYLSTFATPLAQVVEIQRGTQMRGMEFKDAAEDPTLNTMDNVWSEFTRPFRARGYSDMLSPSSEKDLPNREFVFSSDKQRPDPWMKGLLGINIFSKDEEHGQFFKGLGFSEYSLSSKSKIPSVRRRENELIRDQLPLIADIAKSLTESYGIDYDNSLEYNEDLSDTTKEKYVTDLVKNEVSKMFSEVRSSIGDAKYEYTKEDAKAYEGWRRLPDQIRKTATTRFLSIEGRRPDTSNIDDVNILIEIGKMERQ